MVFIISNCYYFIKILRIREQDYIIFPWFQYQIRICRWKYWKFPKWSHFAYKIGHSSQTNHLIKIIGNYISLNFLWRIDFQFNRPYLKSQWGQKCNCSRWYFQLAIFFPLGIEFLCIKLAKRIRFRNFISQTPVFVIK